MIMVAAFWEKMTSPTESVNGTKPCDLGILKSRTFQSPGNSDNISYRA